MLVSVMTPMPMGVKSETGDCSRRTAAETFFIQSTKSSRSDDWKIMRHNLKINAMKSLPGNRACVFEFGTDTYGFGLVNRNGQLIEKTHRPGIFNKKQGIIRI
jgi:hypothetical protein